MTLVEPFSLYEGDCVAVMQDWPEACIDAIVCDPPYGLEFMGKAWDRLWNDGGDSFSQDKGWGKRPASNKPRYVVNLKCRACGKWKWDKNPCRCESPEWESPRRPKGDVHYAVSVQLWHEGWAREAFRVLKPGGHLVAFGGARTYHRLACAIEDAGFEIRDSIHWIYGSGFPKGHRVDVAIDKHLYGGEGPLPKACDLPRTSEGAKWEGYNVALKPSHEPAVLARKPLTGTVAQNVLEFGTGALNVDGCRVETTPDDVAVQRKRTGGVMGEEIQNDVYGNGYLRQPAGNPSGRWPPNLVFSHHPECRQVGAKKVRGSQLNQFIDRAKSDSNSIGKQTSGHARGHTDADGTETVPDYDCHPDCPVRELGKQSEKRKTGTAARFFPCFKYQAKTSKRERNLGLPDDMTNKHPTVKPLKLMQWFVRLVTPPEGLVLDPFIGSGTTAMACEFEGFRWVGIEREAEYLDIAEKRIRWAACEAGRLEKEKDE